MAFHTYSYEAFMNNEFRGGRTFDCPIVPGVNNAGCSLTGEQILSSVSIPDNSYAFNMGILTVMLAGYRILFYLTLKYKAWKESGAQFKGMTEEDREKSLRNHNAVRPLAWLPYRAPRFRC